MKPTLDPDQLAERKAVRQLLLYIFGEVAISVLLIAVNAGMVFGLVQALGWMFPRLDATDELSPSALPQLIIYTLPILLLFLEWYAWDILTPVRRRYNQTKFPSLRKKHLGQDGGRHNSAIRA